MKHTPNAPLAKKAYATPHLRVYGNIRTMTQHVSGISGVRDGGSGAMSKTH